VGGAGPLEPQEEARLGSAAALVVLGLAVSLGRG
jgi:hypothetical protein